MRTSFSILFCLALALTAGCAGNRGIGDAGGTVEADGRVSDVDGGGMPGLGARRLVVHLSDPATSIVAPIGETYLGVELTLVNAAGAPPAVLSSDRFELGAPGGPSFLSIAPPMDFAPPRLACPEDGSIPPDARIHCTALFLIPSEYRPDRIHYLGAPRAGALLAADAYAEAERLCDASEIASMECRACIASVLDASDACESTVSAVGETCPTTRACPVPARPSEECLAAIGAYHLCVDEACPSCGYLGGVR